MHIVTFMIPGANSIHDIQVSYWSLNKHIMTFLITGVNSIYDIQISYKIAFPPPFIFISNNLWYTTMKQLAFIS